MLPILILVYGLALVGELDRHLPIQCQSNRSGFVQRGLEIAVSQVADICALASQWFERGGERQSA